MNKTIIFRLFFLLLSFPVVAQDVPIGGWQEHFSYRSSISVSEGNGRVFCATKSGIFILNKGDNSMTRLSKVSGLSDVEANVLAFNKNDNKLLIAYKNSNLDIVSSDGTSIVNLPDIKRKPIIGNKSINNIFFIGNYAYLACGFGIVVVDLDRYEVKDTYYIGAGGAALNVRDISSDGTTLYAATDQGVYHALLSNPNLANFSNWSKYTTGLPATGIFNTITAFNGNVYANYSKFSSTGTLSIDSIFVYDGSSWSHFSTVSGYSCFQLKNENNHLLVCTDGYLDVYDNAMVRTERLFQYLGDYFSAKSVAMDSDNKYWLADNRYGLIKCNDNYNSWHFYVNGPASANVKSIVSNGGDIWVAHGGVDDAWSNLYQTEGISHYDGSSWDVMRGQYPGIVNTDTLFDLLYLAVDPSDDQRVYASSWWNGVLEFTNKVPTHLYTPANSTLQDFTGFNVCKTAGLQFDKNHNLWICNPFNPYSFSVKHPGGTWEKIDMSTVIGNSPYMGQLLIDKNDQKWCVLTRGGGIFVYKGGTTAAANSGNCKKMTTAAGSGALPSNGVYCLAEDNDGEIWVGTDKGVAVFYSPENVFTGANFDSQQILIEQDGHVQILLETETVQDIAVDDANRKWIATLNSGVFLMSADGTQQIFHFDENNSPLFSNDVRSIAINHKTGEVFFGTSKGIISYRGTATEGNDSFTDVYAYPNPVKHEYTGPIAIKGLVKNTTVKITDISGTFVFETTSEGGQAIWDGKNFNGDRVSSGVYMVFCTSEDGSQKMVTKILLIN